MLRQAAAEGSARAAQNPEARVFIYVRLASFDRDKDGFNGLLELLSIAAGLDRERFEFCWREGTRQMAVLLDGLNEVAREYRPTCVRALATLLQNSPPGHSYVITSRPGIDLEAVADPSENNGLKIADVMSFGPEQVEQYLAAQGLSELKERITEQLYGLTSNPFVLWALTRTLAMTGTNAPNNRGSLFAALVDRYIFEQREQRKPAPPPTQYNYGLVKKPVLAALALKMVEDGKVEIAEDQALWQRVSRQLRELKRQHYRALPLEPETFMPKDFAPASLLTEVVNNGVLIRDGARLRFMHESIQEYFAAVALRDARAEELGRRAPKLNLASLRSRGPMFETLVTWAGLTTQGQAAALIHILLETHPLLAAHVAAESKLETPEVDALRQRFLVLLDSQHEMRRKLGAMGLATVPSTDAGVLGVLVGMLEESSISDWARQALTKLPVGATVPALIKGWIDRARSDRSGGVDLLKELLPRHQRLLSQEIFDAWNRETDSRQLRAAELAARLDQKDRFADEDEPKPMKDTLMAMSVEAELTGDAPLSTRLDALRHRASEFNLPPQEPFADISADIIKRLERLNEWWKTGDELKAAYADTSDEELVSIRQKGTTNQRAAALDLLVERRSILAVEAVAGLAVNHPERRWLEALESLPREEVQRQLRRRIEHSKDEEQENARRLSILMEDTPKLENLAALLQISDEAMREMAVRAAKRAGLGGIPLVFEILGSESSGDVIEAGLRVLGESGDPSIRLYLMDLLFDEVSPPSWPYRDEIRIETGYRIFNAGNGWAALIHQTLVDVGSEGSILKRLADLAVERKGMHSLPLLHEARRLLPAAQAVELLRRLAASQDKALQGWAQWSLARVGHLDVWRQLLRIESDASELAPDFTGDIARKLEETVHGKAKRAAMLETCQDVLLPLLMGSDSRRKIFAVELSCRFPEGCVNEDWRKAIISSALDMMNSQDASMRKAAIPVLFRFSDDAAGRVLKILLEDPDHDVRREAGKILSDTESAYVEDRFRSALSEGETSTAHRIAEASPDNRASALRDAARNMLIGGSCDQFASAVHALSMFRTKYSTGDEWTDLSKLASEGFERNGIEEAWKRFAVNAALLDEDHREFVLDVLEGLWDKLGEHVQIIEELERMWPENPRVRAFGISIDISRGSNERAIERIQRMEQELEGRYNHRWVGDRWMVLGRHADAVRQYQMAVEEDAADGWAQFGMGWETLVLGDLEASLKASRRAVELLATEPMAWFNLGLALLANGDAMSADDAYRRGVAFAKRQAEPRKTIDSSLADFALLRRFPNADAQAGKKLEAWLRDQQNRL
jgi:tetratricopeptide (TPR) repeat protein